MASIVVFSILAVVILGSALLCVTTKRIMRAATYMLFVLFGVAGLYFLLDYTYLGAAQIAVYAGGVTMIYVFAIQLVSKQTLQGMVEHIKCSRMLQGLLLGCRSGHRSCCLPEEQLHQRRHHRRVAYGPDWYRPAG